MIIYLSGPMSGLPDHNYPAFEATAHQLRRNGMTVLTPTSIGQHDGWTWEQYMGAALAMQSRATATYMLPGWRQSRGARIEHEFARALGHRIYGHNLTERTTSRARPPQAKQGAL